MSGAEPVAPERVDERRRMIPVDSGVLTARVAAARPVDFASHRHLGIELMLLGRYDEALDHLDRAVELADTHRRRITVWINLADVHRCRGAAATAVSLYRRAVSQARAVAPEVLSGALQHLGRALAEQGDLARARTLFEEALHLRIAEGDPEEIETTRLALATLDRFPLPLPPAVTALLGPIPELSDDHEGRGGGVVRAGASHWMKRGPHAVREYARLCWLREREVPVAEVAVFAEDVLVLADAGAGSLAARLARDPGAAVAVGTVMGRVLRRLHGLPVADCPFDAGPATLLAAARRAVVEELVDVDDFDDENLGRDPREILAELSGARSEPFEPVVTHGDFTPANLLDGPVVLDVAGLGVGDRHRDLASADRELRAVGGQTAVTAFLDAYGMADPDPRRLAYYRLLDELS